MPETLLEIKNLEISVPRSGNNRHAPDLHPIVRGVSARLEKGKVLGLIGESGAGKSTIGLSPLGYARGNIEVTNGKVVLNGRNILASGRKGLNAMRGKEVCYVAQSAAAGFNPAKRLIDQTIEATLKHGLMSRTDAVARARELYKALSLPDPDTIGDRYPHQVSGGQLQRVMTAMALCPKPDLIIFDEPTTALDVTTQIDVLAAIKSVIKKYGVAAIYITHDLAVVAQVADDIMVLKDGRQVEYGRTAQIIDAPREAYTKALLSVRSVSHHEKQPDKQPVLQLKSVSACYGNSLKVLHDVSLELSEGQTLAIVGESGSGKSTLARVVTGLLSSGSGEIRFEGQPLSRQLAQRTREELRRIQMIYQMADTAMNPRQSIRTIIGRPIEFYFNKRGKELGIEVDSLIEKIDLPLDIGHRYPAELSGGQRQRVCIARALAARPGIIICDEVTSALDPLVADGILKLLLELQARDNVAYLFITHDLATVTSIADSIAVMHQGKVVRYGTKTEVLSPPFDDYTGLLLSSVPQMDSGWLDAAIASRKIA
ncbi:ABC transporter ATP-binding protein [Roseibium sp. RKSG952]|uniref:ABC transporter ATP-binding protein n=1 Tax=Roseibium sp. RKSG952 TaxID=2529384 RepID=UPI0012BC7CF8|nr:ABC transporter ATP-binding protein [Roseibium sp. RKSG952]MTH95570.1 ABC transporter ATP-binding protein [Roseibium sp. RKSG952]